jgi:acyl-CoA synthetase (AMP-forming)/AMP-acid ligase II
MNSIPEILLANAKIWPDREALVWAKHGKDFSMSFSQLASAADGFAGNLIARGVTRGDRVLVFVPMSPALYLTLLGLFRIGATAVFVDPSAGLSHINACCQRICPQAMVAVRLLRLAKPFVSGLRRIPILFFPPENERSALCVAGFPEGNDPALITFTSGSTGHPKAAVRTHRFLMAQHQALASAIQLEAGERDLTTLPVFVLANLASGITSILPDAKISHPGLINAKRVAAQIHRTAPNRTGGSPAFYQRLTSVTGSLTSFRKIYTGGAPVFPSLLKTLKSSSPHTAIVSVYGSTEAEPIAHIETSEIHNDDWNRMETGAGLLAGFPVPQIRVQILPDQWGGPISDFSPQPPGSPGEILVTGDHVLKGYLDGIGDETTKVKIENEIWHRTGDAGSWDEKGRLWLLGRCSARISDSHGTIYPFTVECAASRFVSRSAFVSHREHRLLLVESKRQIPGADLKILSDALAWGKIDRIQAIPKIPVDPRHNAKINYPALSKLIDNM